MNGCDKSNTIGCCVVSHFAGGYRGLVLALRAVCGGPSDEWCLDEQVHVPLLLGARVRSDKACGVLGTTFLRANVPLRFLDPEY